MYTENQVQDIATATATFAAQGFLSTITAYIKEALPARFLSSLEGELQTELQAIIQSRLHWSMQTINLEVAEQQRLKVLEAASSEPPQAECNPQQLVPASRPQAKPRSLKLDNPLIVRAIPSPVPDALIEEDIPAKDPETIAPHQDAQLELPRMSEPEFLKPCRRHHSAPEEMSREEIMNAYNLSPTDFASRPAEAGRRKRCTSIAMS